MCVDKPALQSLFSRWNEGCPKGAMRELNSQPAMALCLGKKEEGGGELVGALAPCATDEAFCIACEFRGLTADKKHGCWAEPP